jgi:hypothetical protein
MADPHEDDSTLPSFRAAKRRKCYRKRADHPSDDEPSSSVAHDSSTNTRSLTDPPVVQTLEDMIASASTSSVPEARSTLSDLLRQRKLLQRKRHGIDYSTTRSKSGQVEAASTELVRHNEEEDELLEQINSRFAAQTGTGVVAVEDKHMFVAPSPF